MNLEDIPIVDFHAHPPRNGTISQYCEEGDEPKALFGKSGTQQTTVLRYIARRYGCKRNLEDADKIIAQRIASQGFINYVTSVLDRENVQTVNLDLFGAKRLGAPRPAIPGRETSGRLEEDFPSDRYTWTYGTTHLVQPAWAMERQANNLNQVLDLLRSDIDEAIGLGARAFKSLITFYRTPQIEKIDPERADRAFRRLVEKKPTGYTNILNAMVPVYKDPQLQTDLKTYQDFMMRELLLLARRHDCPMLIHLASVETLSSQLGTNDPANMYSLMLDEDIKKTRIVMLHGGYPNFRQAAVLPLQSFFTQGELYIDLSLMVYFPPAWRDAVRTIIQFAPIDRIVYGSDAYGLIERLGCNAWWGRRLLSDVLEEFVRKYDWTEDECLEAARLVLCQNAKKLLRIE